ncbi:hypothetical protein O3G_MSEX010545 [Manduca sexta]|uniref:Peroxidase n=1 Tax=Manduca sexta TaxID=7130 RepID=A0A921ZIY4_MANSE|nr:hypothetical protein O3G_MSEX010545 [Manduca sexta]
MDGCKSIIVPLVLLLAWRVSCADYYSSYYGAKLTSAQVDAYRSNGTLANCTNVVEPCNPNEPRRINGTCNNLNNPTRGATRTPYYRLLDASFVKASDSVFNPRVSACTGASLAGARDLRRTLLVDGRVEDDKLTHAVTHMSVFFATDITNTQDTTNYVVWRPYCCKPEGANDPQCAPNLVPADDYVHRFTNIGCLNMTKPLTFQTSGCLAQTTTPLRIVDATPLFDLSPVYGNVDEPARRTKSGGELRIETIDGIMFPPTSGLNLLLGVNFIGIIFFWRFHNHIAKKIAEVNPCWTDEQIFQTAREINIASGSQILYYELMATLMGADNLIADGVLAEDQSTFRDPYDPTVIPQISLEYPAVLRWMHLMQDGALKFYDSKGTYLNNSFPMVNLTSNINFIKRNGNMAYITQGCFRQPTGKVNDAVVDPDLLNLGLGGLQRSNDILTNDLAKNRYFGFPPYVKYREFCSGEKVTSFEDLSSIMPYWAIDALKSKYSCFEDIDLLAGVWMESIIDNGYVPPTFYCIVKEQLLHNIKSDRHWYERADRPNAFSEEQLCEIRKITTARMLCDIGDSVSEIQPRAYELAGDEYVHIYSRLILELLVSIN